MTHLDRAFITALAILFAVIAGMNLAATDNVRMAVESRCSP